MEQVHATCNTPEPICVHKIVGSDCKQPRRKSRSTWKRTKRLLTCSSCGGNDSDNSDAYDGHMPTILDVPLCSGDKNMEMTVKMSPAGVEHIEDGNLASLSGDHFSEVELDRINPEEIIKTVMDKYSPCCANPTISVSDFKAGAYSAVENNERGKVIENIKPAIEKKKCLEIVGIIHVSDYVEKVDIVQDAFQKVSDQEALVDVTEYDLGCNIDEGEKFQNAFHKEPVAEKGPESVTEGEEKSDLLAQADSEITEETSKNETKEAVEVLPQLDPDHDKNFIPQDDDCVLNETLSLPDVEDVDFFHEGFALSSATDGSEGTEQVYLQEVISDRSLRRAEIARRMEFLDTLMRRAYRAECPAEETVDKSLMVTPGDEIVVDSEVCAGLSSIGAIVETVDAGSDVILDAPVGAPGACELESQGIGEQLQANEDADAQTMTATHVQEEVSAVASEVARVDTRSNVRHVKFDIDQNSDYLEAIEGEEPKGHNVTTEYFDYDALLTDILDDEPADAEDDDRMEVGEEELDEDVIIQPKELAASQSDAIIESREIADEVPLEFSAERKCEIIAEGNVTPVNGLLETVGIDEEDIAKAGLDHKNDAVAAEKVIEDDEEAAEISQTFDASSPTCTSRWRGSNTLVSQEFAQEVAQEIIDPMLAQAVHALENDISLASVPSAAWLTSSVADLGSDLGEAFPGRMKPTASINDLDALLNALERTESMLDDFGENSLRSTSTDLDELVTSLETPELTPAGLEEAPIEPVQSRTTVDNLDALVTPLEASDQMPDGLEPFDSATTVDCIEPTSSIQGIDEALTSLKVTESLASFDTASVQPPSTDKDLETSLTSLESTSQADLSAESTASSLIELTHKASLVHLVPTQSFTVLPASSSESIDEALPSPTTSTEEAVMASMAAASSSAEWPDQGKEQHRTARNNNKRNKKRNKRGKK